MGDGVLRHGGCRRCVWARPIGHSMNENWVATRNHVTRSSPLIGLPATTTTQPITDAK